MEKNDSFKELSLKLQNKNALYNSYMPFLEFGGLFVPTDELFSLGEKVLLSVEWGGYPMNPLQTKVAWINPSRTSAHSPKGVGLAFIDDENCRQIKGLIENELGPMISSDRPTYTL